MKKFLTIGVLTALTGCSTASVDSADMPIKFISESKSDSCEYISSVTGTETNFFNSAGDKVPVAKLLAAQEAKKLGANTGVMKDTEIESNGHVVTVTIDAYKCQHNN